MTLLMVSWAICLTNYEVIGLDGISTNLLISPSSCNRHDQLSSPKTGNLPEHSTYLSRLADCVRSAPPLHTTISPNPRQELLHSTTRYQTLYPTHPLPLFDHKRKAARNITHAQRILPGSHTWCPSQPDNRSLLFIPEEFCWRTRSHFPASNQFPYL